MKINIAGFLVVKIFHGFLEPEISPHILRISSYFAVRGIRPGGDVSLNL
jgi:hypothetical protein